MTTELSVQEVMTRNFVAEHMLNHEGLTDGCMVCSAFRLGQEYGNDAKDLSTKLQVLADKLEAFGG